MGYAALTHPTFNPAYLLNGCRSREGGNPLENMLLHLDSRFHGNDGRYLDSRFHGNDGRFLRGMKTAS